jgi:hypothetical protein
MSNPRGEKCVWKIVRHIENMPPRTKADVIWYLEKNDKEVQYVFVEYFPEGGSATFTQFLIFPDVSDDYIDYVARTMADALWIGYRKGKTQTEAKK